MGFGKFLGDMVLGAGKGMMEAGKECKELTGRPNLDRADEGTLEYVASSARSSFLRNLAQSKLRKMRR